MAIPKIGDTHTGQCILYYSVSNKSLMLSSYIYSTPGPELIPCGEPFDVVATVTVDPVPGAISTFNQAREAALDEYTKKVNTINRQQAEFLAIENALADTVEG